MPETLYKQLESLEARADSLEAISAELVVKLAANRQALDRIEALTAEAVAKVEELKARLP